MYIWLDFISKTGHVTYYYILWVFFTEALSQKRDKNKLRRHITDPPPPHVDKHEQFSNPPSPPNLLHSLWMPP